MRAADKYAELEARGEDRPKCECHGVEKVWCKDPERPLGGRWRCVVRKRSMKRTYDASLKGRISEHRNQARRQMKKLAQRRKRQTR